MKTIPLQYDVEQPKRDSIQSPPWRSTKCIILFMVLLVVVLLTITIVVARKGNTNDETMWREVSPELSHLNVTHTLITGVWSDLLVVAGTDNTNNGVVELYKYNKNSNSVLVVVREP